jgi:hypothetical protein
MAALAANGTHAGRVHDIDFDVLHSLLLNDGQLLHAPTLPTSTPTPQGVGCVNDSDCLHDAAAKAAGAWQCSEDKSGGSKCHINGRNDPQQLVRRFVVHLV